MTSKFSPTSSNFGRDTLNTLISVGGFLLLWEASVRIFQVSEFILPGPSAIFTYLIANHSAFVANSAITFAPIVGAVFLSIAAGTFFGMVTADSGILRRLLEPLFLFFEMIPKVALAPILLTWLGFGIESRLFMGTLIGFFPVYASAFAAFSRDSDIVQMYRASWSCGYFSFLFRIRLLYALPRIAGGVQTAVLFAVIGVVVLEFIASGQGIGYLVVERWGRSDTVGAFAAIFVLFLFGSFAYACITAATNSLLNRLNLLREL